MQPAQMDFKEAVKACFSKAFTFTGRARRSEYWYWCLFVFIVSMPFAILLEFVPEDVWALMLPLSMVYSGWSIFCSIASFAVAIRRLHDIGRSGWWYGGMVIYGSIWALIMVIGVFVALLSAVGDSAEPQFSSLIPWLVVVLITYIPFLLYGIVLLVWFCTDSTPGPNKYGENPKGVGTVVETIVPSEEMETEN